MKREGVGRLVLGAKGSGGGGAEESTGSASVFDFIYSIMWRKTKDFGKSRRG